MQCLPSLDANQNCHLPLFGFTAQRLVMACLADTERSQRELLVSAISNDPVLALWVAARAEATGRPPFQSAMEAADWLANCWPTQFQDFDVQSAKEFSSGADNAWQYRLRQSVLAARLAGHLLDGVADETVERTDESGLGYWRALLQQSADWATDCFSGEDAISCLPGWTVEQLDAPDLRDCLQLANQLSRQMLDGDPGPLSAEMMDDQLDEESRRQHLEYVLDHVNLEESGLPAAVGLLLRLARLDLLEHQFAETLQQEKLSSLKELAYGASHEINNPLANISSRAQTLLRDESDPERQRMLATINSQAFRAHEMISDMMLFAKPPRMDRQPVDLTQLVDAVLIELADDAQRQGTTLSHTGAQVPIVIPVDEVQFAEAIKALCRNALESVSVGGAVEVSVESIAPLRLAVEDETAGSCSGAVITVKDDGPGIPDPVRAHLFDPFFSGREAGRGLGFGLSKCWRIVTEHGGQIEVHSSESEGTVFALRFPAKWETLQQPDSESPAAEAG
jgi:signal transduction histidine kinase